MFKKCMNNFQDFSFEMTLLLIRFHAWLKNEVSTGISTDPVDNVEKFFVLFRVTLNREKISTFPIINLRGNTEPTCEYTSIILNIFKE